MSKIILVACTAESCTSIKATFFFLSVPNYFTFHEVSIVVNAIVAGDKVFSLSLKKKQHLERYHVHTFLRNVIFDMATGHA